MLVSEFARYNMTSCCYSINAKKLSAYTQISQHGRLAHLQVGHVVQLDEGRNDRLRPGIWQFEDFAFADRLQNFGDKRHDVQKFLRPFHVRFVQQRFQIYILRMESAEWKPCDLQMRYGIGVYVRFQRGRCRLSTVQCRHSTTAL